MQVFCFALDAGSCAGESWFRRSICVDDRVIVPRRIWQMFLSRRMHALRRRRKKATRQRQLLPAASKGVAYWLYVRCVDLLGVFEVSFRNFHLWGQLGAKW